MTRPRAYCADWLGLLRGNKFALWHWHVSIYSECIVQYNQYESDLYFSLKSELKSVLDIYNVNNTLALCGENMKHRIFFFHYMIRQD